LQQKIATKNTKNGFLTISAIHSKASYCVECYCLWCFDTTGWVAYHPVISCFIKIQRLVYPARHTCTVGYMFHSR